MTMRLAFLLLAAAAAAAVISAAPRAAAHDARVWPPDSPNEQPAHHGCSHHGHHGGGSGHSGHDSHGGHGWMMRRPFSFDGDFESDGSCEVRREGDGRGTLRGSDSCEKNIRGIMTLECEGGHGESGPGHAAGVSTRLTARSRSALGGALSSRLSEHAGGDAPPGFVDAFVEAALAEAPPEMLDDALMSNDDDDDGREGGALTLNAKARFDIKCALCDAAPLLCRARVLCMLRRR
jgi:hypothetical protein